MQGTIQRLSDYRKQSIGFAFFLAWCYCSFFSCGLVSKFVILDSIERLWWTVGLLQAITAIFAMALSSRFPVDESKLSGVIAGFSSAVGTVLIWTSFFNPVWYFPMSTAGGLLSGIGLALLALAWGRRLSSHKQEQLEFAVPLSFIVAFGIYFPLLIIKGPLFLIVDTALPIISAWFAFFADPKASTNANEKERAFVPGRIAIKQFMGLATLFLLNLLLWFQFAYFRVLASPDVIGDRFVHYLTPFSCSFVLAIIAFRIYIRRSRYLNFTLMYRWPLPLMVFSYVLLFFDQGFFDQKIVAYAVNFVAMFGVQFGCWIVAPKYAQRMGISPTLLFGGLIASEGIGIAVGSNCAFFFTSHFGATTIMLLSLLFMGVVLLASMVVGFNPNWVFLHGAARRFGDMGGSGISQKAYDSARQLNSLEHGDELPDLFEQKAIDLQREYGLTSRETEIAALLLAGRDRPYIRDELIISLNTVHAHVRNIYAKCNVHSRREFMDLMEDKTSNHS